MVRDSEFAASIAIISCIPPIETGIATATLLTYLDAGYDVDIFAPFENEESYDVATSNALAENGRVRIFDLRALPFAAAKFAYAGHVFVIGNSHHHVPVARALQRMAGFERDSKLFVHVHDPVMLYLARLLAQGGERNFDDVVFDSYSVEYDAYPGDDEMVRAGFCGLKAVLGKAVISGIIVNSIRAKDLLKAEFPAEKIHTLFHPVFDIVRSSPERNVIGRSAIRIGTFGVPHEKKATDLVVAAFREFRKISPDSTLVIAGYGARAFCAARQLAEIPGVEFVECSDEEFDGHMRAVDMAVQLRTVDWGESSGVLARLLSLDIPLIASPVGAFMDYAGVVSFFPREGTATDLADLMSRSLSTGEAQSEARIAYRQAHSTARFCRLLSELVGS